VSVDHHLRGRRRKNSDAKNPNQNASGGRKKAKEEISQRKRGEIQSSKTKAGCSVWKKPEKKKIAKEIRHQRLGKSKPSPTKRKRA